MQNNEQENIQK